MKFGISQNTIDEILKLIEANLGDSQDAKVYIYGSRVKGSYRDFSDIDLLLIAQSYDKEALSKIDFSESDIPYKVDFVLEPDLYDGYREEILNHKQEFK